MVSGLSQRVLILTLRLLRVAAGHKDTHFCKRDWMENIAFLNHRWLAESLYIEYIDRVSFNPHKISHCAFHALEVKRVE